MELSKVKATYTMYKVQSYNLLNQKLIDRILVIICIRPPPPDCRHTDKIIRLVIYWDAVHKG